MQQERIVALYMAYPSTPRRRPSGASRLLRILRLLPLVLAAATVAGLNAAPAAAQAVTARKGSGLPVPRFASLRSEEVNVRTGPGTRYPVDWVFKRKYMPVEVIGEFENWRKIRDWQGASGWVHQSLLTGRRYFVVTAKEAELHATPANAAGVVAKVEPEVIGEIRTCQGDWCRVRVTKYTGWLERKDIWGVYRGETVN